MEFTYKTLIPSAAVGRMAARSRVVRTKASRLMHPTCKSVERYFMV